MIAVAAVFGLLAVFVAQTWLNSQAEAQRRNQPEQRAPQIAARTLVVATKPLRFGNELTAEMLRETPWPDAAPPPGAFTKISDVLNGGKRVVLTAIEANEPVLAMKITGVRTARDAVGPGGTGHEGGHHPGQRRRRRRRLRAARRPGRHRVDPAGKGKRVLAGPAAGHTHTRGRPECRRARLKPVDTEIG